jgi:hypothetical protein
MYGRVSKYQPEITGVLNKHAPPHHALTDGDTALKQLARLLKARRCVREQHIRVSAVRPQRKRPAREHEASRPGGLPRLVDQILGAVPRLRSVPLGAARDHGEVVLHPSQNQYRSSRTSPLPAWSAAAKPVLRTHERAARAGVVEVDVSQQQPSRPLVAERLEQRYGRHDPGQGPTSTSPTRQPQPPAPGRGA